MKTVKFLILSVGALPAEYDPYDVSYQYDNSQYDYSYLDYGDIDKGKNKKKKEIFVSKQQLDPEVMTEPSAYNGHQCWTCNSDSYADCQTNGQIAYCESEEFNCFIREHKLYEDVIKVHMGCQQTLACHREFENNNRFYGMDMPVIAGMHFDNFRLVTKIRKLSNQLSGNVFPKTQLETYRLVDSVAKDSNVITLGKMAHLTQMPSGTTLPIMEKSNLARRQVPDVHFTL